MQDFFDFFFWSFWGPGALGFGRGASWGSFLANFHLLGCLGARIMTKKPFWKFSIKYFEGFSYINCIFGLPQALGPVPSDSS